MKLLITILFTLVSAAVGAQKIVFSESFKNFSSSNFVSWEFIECCTQSSYDKFLQVGTGSSPSYNLGCLYTKELGIYGNVTLLIETKNADSQGAEFRVTIDGNGLTSSESYIVLADNETHHPSAILIRDCTPSTRIKIEGTTGIFYIVSMTVYAINDAFFFESFDYMIGRPNYEFYISSTNAKATSCDNSFYTTITESNVSESVKSLYLENKDGNYILSSIPVPNQSKVLLTFTIGHVSNNNRLTISCSNDASITDFNSTNLATLNNSHMISSLGAPHTKWIPYSMIVNNMSESTSLTFNGANMSLNDVKLSIVPTNLDQSKNNDTYIIANADQTRSVNLIRTLKQNIWCPLCLPFDVTKTKMETAMGTTCELCTLSSIDNGVFKFEIATSTIPAGTPFLVRVAETVTNPEFKEVTIVNTPAATATASTENYQFVGTYSPVDLETDGTNLFLATDGALYKPTTDGNRLGGLRAYFVVPATSGAGARVMIPEIVSDIRSPRDVTPATKYEIYDLRGQRVSSPYSKGVFIHNGKRLLVP